ncbi:hypothetical protein MVEN_00436100 [Mycena venus]|uniref:Glycosyltransferase 61 catalytic domain-containing protein n=1 Tax=Mycena venus TaxID=2733690 RepID=A0A8H6YQZ2_9AGAR|nr:hypothetical protein MVEN_00436100 [Mycena venus]
MNSLPFLQRRLYFAVLSGISALIILSFYLAFNRLERSAASFTDAFDSSNHSHSLRPSRPNPLNPPHFSDALRPSTPHSDPWMPLSLSACSFGMPAHYAPCAAQKLKNVEYAEELLYPDFAIREPYFAQEEHRQKWRTFTQTADDFDRASLHLGWMQYKGQTGQNFVFRGVRYAPTFGVDSWSPKSCMSSLVETSPIQPITDANRPASTLPTALIALSPDSYSFQHFLDRVTHILAQGHHLLDSTSAPYALTGRGGTKTVDELWSLMGFPEDHVLHQNFNFVAERLIFSCRAILIHPWLSLKTLDVMGVPRTSPSTTRNKVVYMSRSHGGAVNGGRRVVNEDAVLRGITTFLEERDRGEELVMFNPDNFGNVTELFSWFSKNAMAVVGPHGGAMINHRWANKDIFVLEFMPANRIAMMNYEEASILSQTYAAIIVEPTTPSSFDMEIDVQDVVSLLSKHLGVEGEDPLRKSYTWRAEELGFR